MLAHGVWEAIEPKNPKATVDDKVDKWALAIIYQGVPRTYCCSLMKEKGPMRHGT